MSLLHEKEEAEVGLELTKNGRAPITKVVVLPFPPFGVVLFY